MRLGERWLSTGPEDPATHWRQVLMPLEEPLELSAGDRIGFELKRPRGGEWTWTTRVGNRVTRQSSFLSRPVTFKDFGKGSD